MGHICDPLSPENNVPIAEITHIFLANISYTRLSIVTNASCHNLLGWQKMSDICLVNILACFG